MNIHEVATRNVQKEIAWTIPSVPGDMADAEILIREQADGRFRLTIEWETWFFEFSKDFKIRRGSAKRLAAFVLGKCEL